jgi:hypothetical protein
MGADRPALNAGLFVPAQAGGPDETEYLIRKRKYSARRGKAEEAGH